MALHVSIDTNEEECLKTLRQALERGDTEAINRIHDSHIHKAKFRSIEISKLRQDTFAISSLLSEDIVQRVIQFEEKPGSVFAASSSDDGNCLFNSCSLAMCGDESLRGCLRILTCIELYNNADYYANHPSFQTEWRSPNCKFEAYDSIFTVSISDGAYDKLNEKCTNKEECIKEEAILLAEHKVWTSLICMFALSSVIGAKIASYHPPYGNNAIKHFFNTSISPRGGVQLSTDKIVNILWSRSGSFDNKPGTAYSANHFVPLFIYQDDQQSSHSAESGPDKRTDEQNPDRLVQNQSYIKRYSQSNLTVLFKKTTKLVPKADEKQEYAKNKRKRSSDDLPTSMSNPKQKRKCQAVLVCSNKDDVNVNDIGLFVYTGQELEDSEIVRFVENVWKPPVNYKFPTKIENGKTRKFRCTWLTEFPWLAYSMLFDGCFCVPCVLFGDKIGHSDARLKNLYRQPLTYWTSASTKFKEHQSKSQVHKDSSLLLESYKKMFAKEAAEVHLLANEALKERIDSNRQKLTSILDAIIFCGQQGLALRGHRDDAGYVELQHHNPGNFQALLNYRIRSGDKILEEHFKNCPRNATYRSKTIQNELIECVGDHILNKIIHEVKSAKFFSILSDEVSNVSGKEQMPIVLRFIDSEANIREEFVKFVYLDGTSGQQIADGIKKEIREMGLDMVNCRGQGYDGAGNMSGKYIGAAQLVKNDHPKALYIHCASHRLNLCVSNSCQIPSIIKLFGAIRKASFFFSFPKRLLFLQKVIREKVPSAKRLKLIDVCATRWVERIDALEIFEELFEAVVLALERISNNEDGTWQGNCIIDANGLHGTCTSFEFILALVVSRRGLSYTKPVTISLQKEDMEIAEGYKDIQLLKRSLSYVRENLEVYHEKWFEVAVELGSKIGTVPTSPRICSQQTLRENPPAKTSKEYYRRALTAPFLDHMVTQIDLRFTDQNLEIMKGFVIVPENIVNRKADSELLPWKEEFKKFLKIYEDDLSPFNNIETEMDMWELYWKTQHQKTLPVPKKLSTTLKEIRDMKVTFPTIFTALQLLVTIPVTTCECERSNSVLKRLKTYLRSTIGQERLNGLAQMNIHYDSCIYQNFDEIINDFSSRNPRRMRFKNILDCEEKQVTI